MCGIVGYIGHRDATPIIMNGLQRLEYRGYDSAGLAVLQDGDIEIRRDAGKIASLIALVNESPVSGTLGIGHTRWATHGVPNRTNSHPHLGQEGKVVVVHNGIVENYVELRDELLEEGVEFKSDTDSEVIVQLVEKFYTATGDIVKSAQQALAMLKGHQGVVLYSKEEPDKIIAARLGNAGGVVIGAGENETFIASDMPAILNHTRNICFLESQQMAVVQKEGFGIFSLQGDPIEIEMHNIPWDPVAAEKGEYRHFMQKEIHEQVRSITDTISGRVDFDKNRIHLDQLNLTPNFAKKINRIIIIACGTAMHAGEVGKYLIEHIARIPVEVAVASEFRYRDSIIDENTVVISVSQSGETADTLAAMAEAKKKGATLWSIVNVIGSQSMRISDGYISMQTGPEIGVASTKAYTAPLVDFYMLAILLADLREVLDPIKKIGYIQTLRSLPDLVDQTISFEAEIEEVARATKDMTHCLYLGRGINMATAYEGALKLKEISYIHAEGYPAGEMKHGPIALVDEEMPVIAIALKDHLYEKMISQIEQVKARDGEVIAVATVGDELIKSKADYVLWVPEVIMELSPVLAVIPLQIYSYYIAALRGLDVDQPRNLAKSVTVE